MNSRLVLTALLSCGFALSAGAAEPADTTLLKQCESAQGEVKRECERVAKEMLRKDPETLERSDKPGPHVTHSGPAMETPSDAKQKPAQPSAQSTPQADPKPGAKPAPKEPAPKPE